MTARKTEIDGRFSDSEENHHFIWHLGPSCVARRSRKHFKSKQGVCLMPTLGRNAPWSRCTVSLRSRRQRERPRSTGDSEGNHHFIWHLGPSCVAKRTREHFKSGQGVRLMPTLERDAPWGRCTVSLCSRRQRERPKSTSDFEENHHFILHLGPCCIAKRSREHFKSKQGVHPTPILERNAPLEQAYS